MQDYESYLIGLICARGHILKDDRRIIIEFAHKNKTIEGIAYCHKCGDFATTKKEGNPEAFLFCKSCGTKVDPSVKKVYEQKESTITSLKDNIIPYIAPLNAKTFIIGNDHMTFLILEFDKENKSFDYLSYLFKEKYGFDNFEIPEEMYSEDKTNKIEFVSGFMDAAGFFNSGGWLNRDGKNGKGRMRAYFQIVRNWKMPVLICNFLKNELSLPIHTIDWGHPNIRDSMMKDYYDSNPLSWSREHQVKFFPEYYVGFNLRIVHKKNMFDELKNHNEQVVFENSDDCRPPKPIGPASIKPYHFSESDTRIPPEIRKHYDAYWQVCHDLGCIYAKESISKSRNPDLAFITGEDVEGDFDELNSKIDIKRKQITDKIIQKYEDREEKEKKKLIKTIRENPEKKLYEPISKWFTDYLSTKFSEEVKVHDTSSFYLDKFIIQNDLYDEFSFCDEYKIKPDIVGFLINSNRICFAEIKIGELTLKDIGQLLGYCLVGNPEVAILVSPEKPSVNLIKILKSKPDLLRYNSRRILIGAWNKDECEILEF